ncbi:MAG: ATP-binding protein [Acidobacteriota bacterium]|nr:ATP-binding protein [Acidobacteriota bacterium]
MGAICLFPGLSGERVRFEKVLTDQGAQLSETFFVLQDRYDFLWFATNTGLYRYDGYTLFPFLHEPDNPQSIMANFSLFIVEDRNGHLWVALKEQGISKLEPETGCFTNYRAVPGTPNEIIGSGVNILHEDADGRIWAGTEHGACSYDPRDDTWSRYLDDESGDKRANVSGFANDDQGRLWITTRKGGPALYDKKADRFTRIPGIDDSLEIQFLKYDEGGYLWVADEGNLFKFDYNTNTLAPNDIGAENWPVASTIYALHHSPEQGLWVGAAEGLYHYTQAGGWESFKHNPLNPHSLSSSTIYDLQVDRFGAVWCATFQGVNRYSPLTRRFAHYTDVGENDLWSEEISCFTPGTGGAVLIGTKGGLNRFDAETRRLQRIDIGRMTNSEGENNILALHRSTSGVVWIGTEDGLKRLNEKTGETRWTPKGTNGLADARVLSLKEDSRGRMWIGTREGLFHHLLDKDSFAPARSAEDVLSDGQIVTIAETGDGALWIGTTTGLVRMEDPEDPIVHYRAHTGNARSLSRDYITTVYESTAGRLWVATFGGGLNLMTSLNPDQTTPVKTIYTSKNGLPSDSIFGLHEDNRGRLWIGTQAGLACLDPIEDAIRSYGVGDGVPGSAYYLFQNPARPGEVYFGSKGFTLFEPDTFEYNNTSPRVVFTDYRLANREPDGVPPSTIHLEDELVLEQKDFPLYAEFAALHYANPGKNRYQYMLENSDEDWIDADARKRFTSYNRLPAGDYVLRVRAATGDGDWSTEEAHLKLIVKPPIWATLWARIGYVLALGGIIFAYVRAQQRKLAYQNKVNVQLKQVDRLKDEFLANTSHELRTPLNGIIGLAESLIDGATGKLPESTYHHLRMITSSGKRLSHLVNDILDFSKLRNHTLHLRKRPVDLNALTDVVMHLSEPLIIGKDVTLENRVPKDLPAVPADEDRMQQVLYNLIGNAIKFTPSGSITVTAVNEDNQVTMAVRDTGIGIPPEKHESIFYSFQQADGSLSREYSGTGLGLTITRQLLELHDGRIRLESEPGKGSVFYFSLPVAGENSPGLTEEEPNAEEPMLRLMEEAPAPHHEDHPQHPPEPAEDQSFHILVVDDEPVNRQVLLNHLQLHRYKVTEAAGGKQALEAVDQDEVDLVLLDVMMPGMSGYQVCESLRRKYSVQDLPILFLTARSQVADLIDGFRVGANDYLAKPVDKNELLSRVHTHLQLLDINRNLENKVVERTSELNRKNEEILRTQNQLVLQEKMATLGTLTAGIAHEINNPNNFIYIGAENLESEHRRFYDFLMELAGGDEADQEILDSFVEWRNRLDKQLGPIKRGSERIGGIVKDLHLFTRLDQAKRKRVDVIDGLRSTVNLVRSQYAQYATIDLSGKEKLVLDCWPAELNQVFLNIILNACESIRDKHQDNPDSAKGHIQIEVEDLDGETVFRFDDDGRGFGDGDTEKIFEAFYTTKGVGRRGLGLYTSYRIVEKHGGHIKARARQTEGARFEVYLPHD